MADPDAYVALVASLPGSERLFVAKQPPLSRIRLDRRLRALSPEDAETLSVLEGALSWSSYGMEVSDAEAIARGRAALARVPQPTLRALMAERLEVRTAVAAIRRRLAGVPAPTGAWGFGRYRRRIVARWSEPTFGLDRPYPWMREAVRLAEARETLDLERHLLEQTYRMMRRHGAAHQFDFEAVAIYVLTWNIFDRWARTNAEAATRRFEALTLEALSDFPELRAET